jgi:N-acetylmuramic acid 6-phosphate etherase
VSSDISTDNSLEKQLLGQLSQLISESRNPDTLDIDIVSTEQVLARINQLDQAVPIVVAQCIPQIAIVVDAVVLAFAQGGRLIYIGAGTSGRLGVLDAVECGPTFSVEPQQVQGLIAGGSQAMYKAVEGAEDDFSLAEEELKQLNLNQRDVLVGIAASGRTPYVIGGIRYANQIGAFTAAIACNPDSEITKLARVGICAEVGAEALTGSTRMKAGTAQKLILNMLSTASMIRSGKSYQNLMVDVNATNEKLVARASRIVMQATDCSHEQAKTALVEAEYHCKTAILMLLTSSSAENAHQMLHDSNGFLRAAVNASQLKE